MGGLHCTIAHRRIRICRFPTWYQRDLEWHNVFHRSVGCGGCALCTSIHLDELGLRTPTLDNPWSKDEFMAALDAAKHQETMNMRWLGTAWTGEWYPYAFSPFLQSFGGDMIDRSSYKTAEGALNGDAAIAFGEWWQNLFTGGYAQATQDGADRDTGFNTGKYAFSWNGNWCGWHP